MIDFDDYIKELPPVLDVLIEIWLTEIISHYEPVNQVRVLIWHKKWGVTTLN